MENIEYIDNYFRGELNIAQNLQFEQRVAEDTAFAADVSFYINSLQAAYDQSAEEKKRWFRQLYTGNRQGRYVTFFKKAIPYLAAAAIIGVILVQSINPSSPQQLADDYIKKDLAILGIEMGVTDSMQMAIALCNKGKLREALQQFEAITRTDTANTDAKIFAGIVSLKLENYDQAVAWFKQVENRTDLYSNPATFYHALTLLKRNLPNDPQEARRLLQQVVDMNLDKKEEAEKLLKKL